MDPNADTSAPTRVEWLRLPASVRVTAALMRLLFFLAAGLVLVIVGAIFVVLATESVAFFREVNIVEFLTGTEWYVPGTLARAEGAGGGEYGVLPLVSGTLLVATGAAVIGLPLGVATAVYLAEYASDRVRGILKPVLELLAGVPSIVFGFVALLIISPILQSIFAEGTFMGETFGVVRTFSALNAIIVVGIMVLPIVTSISEDAIRAVPRHLKEASLGLGATRWETTRHVVLPAAISGITASFVLGITRAIGETMAVMMAAGTQPNLTFNPLDAIQTMTAFIAQRATGDTPQHGPPYTSLFAVGLTLFLMTLAMNLIAQRFVRRYREVEA